MDTGLRGKSAIVTGGAGAIGRACVAALVAEGADVVLSDAVPASPLGRVADELGATGVDADVCSATDVERLIGEVTERFGRLDVLVTCAGLFDATPLDELTLEQWDLIHDVNLRGTFLCIQGALRVMVPRRSGRIVTIASMGAQTGGPAAGAAYVSSKAGVVALTKSAARFAGPYGITVNTVNPGVIDTPMTRPWVAEQHDRVRARTPLGRLGTAEEVASVVCMLASDRASFVHGAHVDVNGGLLMD